MNFQNKARKKRWESILFLEHPASITAGVSSDSNNLLVKHEFLRQKEIFYSHVARGGDHTGHELGQIVVYFHIDLKKRQISIAEFLNFIQDFTISSIKETWNIELVPDKESPGLYWKENPEKKIVSMGIYFKSFFTSFGIAINLNNSGEIFQYINPCGISSSNMMNLLSLGAESDLKNSFIQRLAGKWENVLKNYPPNNEYNIRWL
ncbi:MAG: lipoyl(octanoyl) transferase LipB [Leptospira sp.]|nr:lipoyl(octanoyl) transferase LipB [Leptospira sp.]